MERLICPEGVAFFNVVLVFYLVRGVGVFFGTFSRSLSLSLFFNWVKLTDRDFSHLFYGVRISNA